MKERILPSDSVQTCLRYRTASFRPLLWMLFLVSVGTFADSWAQSMSLPTNASLIEAYRQQQSGKNAAAPETYRAPDFDLAGTSVPTTVPSVPSFGELSEEPGSPGPQGSLPKPAGVLTRFGSQFFTNRGEAYRPPVGPVSPQYRLGPGVPCSYLNGSSETVTGGRSSPDRLPSSRAW